MYTAGKKIDGGRILCEQSVLKQFASKTLFPKDYVALEATTNTWSVVDIIEPHVAKIVVGNPVKTNGKSFWYRQIKGNETHASASSRCHLWNKSNMSTTTTSS
jgi:hypothetical protein